MTRATSDASLSVTAVVRLLFDRAVDDRGVGEGTETKEQWDQPPRREPQLTHDDVHRQADSDRERRPGDTPAQGETSVLGSRQWPRQLGLMRVHELRRNLLVLLDHHPDGLETGLVRADVAA